MLGKVTEKIEATDFGLEELIDIPSDGPNISISLYNQFHEALKEGRLHGLLPLLSCTLHLRQGLISMDAEELAFDIYYCLGTPYTKLIFKAGLKITSSSCQHRQNTRIPCHLTRGVNKLWGISELSS